MAAAIHAFAFIPTSPSASAQTVQSNPAHLDAESRDRSAFESKYRGKVVEFQGTINHILHEGNDSYISFNGCAQGKPCSEYYCCGAVYCLANDKIALEKAPALMRNKASVTARGVYAYIRFDRPVFGQCEIPALQR